MYGLNVTYVMKPDARQEFLDAVTASGVLEATRQEVIRSHAPGDNDLYVRTLELGQVQERD